MKSNELKIGAMLSYVNLIASLVIGFLISPFIIKQLGPSEYGVYNLVASLIGYVSILDFGMHNAVIRYIAKYNVKKENENQANFLAISVIIYSLITCFVLIVGFLLYNNISAIFSSSLTMQEINIAKKLFIILIINLACSLPGGLFSAVVIAYEKFIFSKVIQMLKTVLRACLIYIILSQGAKSIGIVLIDFALNFSIIMVNAIYCVKKLNIKIKLYNFDLSYIVSIFNYTFYVFLAMITDQINWKIDNLVVGILTNSSSIAVYSIAMQLIGYYRALSGAISGVFLPRATKMVAQNCSDKQLTDLLIKVGRYQFLVIGLILTGFILLGKRFILLWIGQQYTAVYAIFIIISFALIVPSCQSIGINILEAKNLHKFRAKIYLLIAIFNLIITIPLVNKFNIIGASIGTAIALIIGNVLVMNWYYNNVVGLHIKRYFKEVFLKNVLWVFLVNIFCLIIFKLVKFSITWFDFIIQILIIIIVYFVIVFMKILTKREKSQIFAWIKILIAKECFR